MDGDFRRAGQERLFEFFDEHTLAADPAQGRRLVPVSLGGHAEDFDVEIRERAFDTIPDVVRLPHGEFALARSDSKLLEHGAPDDSKVRQ